MSTTPALPQPLRTPPPPGGTGNPSQDAVITQHNMINKQSSLVSSATKGGKGMRKSKRMSKRMSKRGGGEIVANTITPRYTETMAGSQAPGNQQLNGLKSINQSQVQGAQDKVPLVTGGKKARKARKTRKTRKSRKSKKTRKSKKSRKGRK